MTFPIVTVTLSPTGVFGAPAGAIVHAWVAGVSSTLPERSVATAVNV